MEMCYGMLFLTEEEHVALRFIGHLSGDWSDW